MSSHPLGGCLLSAFLGDDDGVVFSFFGLDRSFDSSVPAETDASGVTGVEANGFTGAERDFTGLLFRFGAGGVSIGDDEDDGDESLDATGSGS
jgi:hypothetical protein